MFCSAGVTGIINPEILLCWSLGKQIKIFQCVNICFEFGVIKCLFYAPVSTRRSILLIFFFLRNLCLGFRVKLHNRAFRGVRYFFFFFLSHDVVKQMDRRAHKICRAINPTICRDSNAARIQPLSALVCKQEYTADCQGENGPIRETRRSATGGAALKY